MPPRSLPLCLVASAALACVLAAAAAPPVQKPNTPVDLDVVELTLWRVARLPRKEIPIALTEMAAIIRRRGVRFRLDASAERALRAAGANAELIGALRDSYRDGGAAAGPAADGPAAAKTAPARQLASAISAGALDGRVAERQRVVVPEAHKGAGLSGPVVVQVLVDESGGVVRAQALSGEPLLRKAAEEAALRSKIKPFILGGQPVIVKGTLTLRP